MSGYLNSAMVVLHWLASLQLTKPAALPMVCPQVLPTVPHPWTNTAPLVIDTIKLAEEPLPAPAPAPATSVTGHSSDGQVAVVVRMYEPHGARGTVKFTWCDDLAVERVTRCNLLEDDLEVLYDVTAGSTGQSLLGPMQSADFVCMLVSQHAQLHGCMHAQLFVVASKHP